jgi:hypothetical protein
MALEDFTTYTEVDPNSDIVVTTDKCDVSTMRLDEHAYVRKDMGAGHFGSFVHYMTVYTGSGSGGDYASAMFWAVSNGANGYTEMLEAESGLGCDVTHFPAAAVYIYLWDLETAYYDYWTGASPNTLYYCTIERVSGVSLVCKIYSDAARANLLDTLSVSTVGGASYRYIFGMASNGEEPPSAPAITFYSKDLDLESRRVNVGASGVDVSVREDLALVAVT